MKYTTDYSTGYTYYQQRYLDAMQIMDPVERSRQMKMCEDAMKAMEMENQSFYRPEDEYTSSDATFHTEWTEDEYEDMVDCTEYINRGLDYFFRFVFIAMFVVRTIMIIAYHI